MGKYDTGNIAWVLISAGLVMFMTPGLALFYGGMVRAKNVLGMLMQNVFCLGIVSILWAVVCYSLVFGGTGRSSATSTSRSSRTSRPCRAVGPE